MFGMSKPPPAKRKLKAPAATSVKPSAKAEPEGTTIEVSLPLNPEQHAKLKKLGGAKWLLAQIDKA